MTTKPEKKTATNKATAKKTQIKAPKIEETPDFISFQCLPVAQGAHTLYMFNAKAATLWPIVQINTKEEDKEEGYQRVLSPSRVRSIASYIRDKNPIPLSILLTFEKADVSNDGHTLKVPNIPNAAWLIDGQHRLAGAHQSQSDIELPVIAFIGLDIESQIQQFITINREAKGVPTSLYYDLLKHIPIKKPQDVANERAANLANDLKRDEESPFFGKIVVTSTARVGQLSLNNFVRKMSPLLMDPRGILAVYTASEQAQILSNYYKGLQNAFPKEFNKPNSVFFQTLGFGALINAFPLFLNLSIKNYGKFRIEDVTAAFNEIRHFDFSSWDRYGSGSAAEIQAGEDLQTELNAAFTTIDSGGSIQLQ
jgi:DGQHR domain-containing protein